MSNLTTALLKFLVKNHKLESTVLVDRMKSAERFVCTDAKSLPEVENIKLAKQKMVEESLPLPFDNLVFELHITKDYPVLVHVIREKESPGFVSLTVFCPIHLNSSGVTVAYYAQGVLLKGTENQKWKMISLVNDPYLFVKHSVTKEDISEIESRYGDTLDGIARTSATFFVSFLKVISASNTFIHCNKVSNLKKQRYKGMVKDYYTVRLNKPKKINESKGGGSHKSPIPHTRRSHIRRCASGKTTIIPSSYINAHMGSTNNKHYEF